MTNDDHPTVQDILHWLGNELCVVSGTAQLLLRRLQRVEGDTSALQEACHTLLNETQFIEQLLIQLRSDSKATRERANDLVCLVEERVRPSMLALTSAHERRSDR